MDLLLLLQWCSTEEEGWCWLEEVVLAIKKKNIKANKGKKKNGSDLHVLTLWTNNASIYFTRSQ
jgi:hypothetical protein